MKRILLAFAIGTASLLTLNSCTKEYVTTYLPGKTYDPIIPASKWTALSTGSNIYKAELDFPEINGRIVDDGTVQVALMFTGSNGFLGSYDAIPATINGIHYSYNYTVGRLTIYAEIRSNSTDLDIDYPVKAKITISEADYFGN